MRKILSTLLLLACIFLLGNSFSPLGPALLLAKVSMIRFSASESTGYTLAKNPMYNKGMSFTAGEKTSLGLQGLYPAGDPQSLELKVQNLMTQLRLKTSAIEKYIFLHMQQDSDEVLYYAALMKHTEELMPFVYTPTVGEACQKWSSIFRGTPRGLYLSINDKGSIRRILDNHPESDIEAIVVTDGERILGLGDLGVNGMGIPIGKLALYTACAGINPAKCLPVHIDVGTDTASLLADPMYMGLRHKRIRTEVYDELIREFFAAVQDKYGKKVLIQFEDFGNSNAFRLLAEYKDKALCFNDDIQGTASVVLAGVLATLALAGKKRLSDHTFLFFGAGEAGVGIADLLVTALTNEDAAMTVQVAREKIWLVDSKGLVTSARMEGMEAHKRPFAHTLGPASAVPASLLEAVKLIRPTALFGLSTQGQAFTKAVCEEMAESHGLGPQHRPLIFALSNPTSKAECTAVQAYEWTDGRAIFASGSPFDPVDIVTKAGTAKSFVPGQGNNAYIFPGVGLGALVAQAATLTDEDFYLAAACLASLVTPERLQQGCAYPPLRQIREVSLQIAAVVAQNVLKTGRSVGSLPKDSSRQQLLQMCQQQMFNPHY